MQNAHRQKIRRVLALFSRARVAKSISKIHKDEVAYSATSPKREGGNKKLFVIIVYTVTNYIICAEATYLISRYIFAF